MILKFAICREGMPTGIQNRLQMPDLLHSSLIWIKNIKKTALLKLCLENVVSSYTRNVKRAKTKRKTEIKRIFINFVQIASTKEDLEKSVLTETF